MNAIITLREPNDDDLPIFFEHQRDPDATRMAAFAGRTREAFMIHWRERVLADPRNGKQTILVDGEVAGNVVSWDHDADRFVGYWIGRSFWGRGIATAALGQYLEIDRVRPLLADVAGHNLGSIRVLEKWGFQRVGGLVTGPDGIAEWRLRLDG